jgi:hypothetical protein
MSDCILWPGPVTSNGYGYVHLNGAQNKTYVHRLMLGEPDGIVGHACHDAAAHRGECPGGACEHRRCINPAHLTVMTHGENLSASPHTRTARKFDTHCQRGHEFTPENTIIESKGKGYRGRKCRACKQARERGDI